MSNKLSDIVDFNPSRMLKKGTIAPFIEMASLPTNTKFIKQIDEKPFSGGSKFKNGDTLFARITPCLENGKTGKVTNLKDEMIGHGSTEFIVMSAKEPEFDEDYIYYFARLPEFREFAQQRMVGTSGRQRVAWQDLADFEFIFPPKEQRKKAAALLNIYDQKIDLNTQINQTLEQIAQALFKSWFVDFDPVRAKVQALSDCLSLEQAELAAMQAISGKTPEELTALSQTQPERYAELAETAKAFPCEMVEVDGVEVPKGWEVKPLGDLISFVKGKKPKSVSPKQEENMLPHILTSSLEGKYNEFCESNKLVTIEYHNTIMLMDGSNSGRIAIGHNGVIGSTLAKINLDNNKLWAVIYQFLKHKEADIQANTTGTTIPHTDKNRVNNYLMVIPDNFLLEKFTELFDNSLLKIISNRNQIISLETIRDLLLPRLLNGEIQL